MSLRTVRSIAWLAVAVAAAAALTLVLLSSQNEESPVAAASIGGPFELQSATGETVTEKDLVGHPSLLFFGYTYCPDICPTTLFEATAWLERLGDDADKLKVYFVTVDPERDTRAVLSEYLQAFDPRITALTGSRAAVDRIIAGYRVFARKVPRDDGRYLMDHTATVHLLDRDAKLAGAISYGEDPDIAFAKIERLIGS